MAPRLYSPRAKAQLIVPAFGSTFAQAKQLTDAHVAQVVDIRVKRCELIHNDLHTADEAVVSCDYDDCAVDPRLIRNGILTLWIEDGDFDIANTTPRFIGIAVDVQRRMNADAAPEVVIRAHDYTRLYLDAKYPMSEVPGLNTTVRDAWAKLCDNTGWWDPDEQKIVSTVAVLRDRLIIKAPGIEGLKFSDAVTGRVKTLGSLPVPQNANGINAWTVWQHIMLYLGLVSYVDGDTVVVTNTTEFYRNDQAGALVWGQNLLELTETVNTKVAAKGVALTSFDPISGKAIESFYPPPGDPRVKNKRTRATKKHAATTDVSSTENSNAYEYFEYHIVHEQDLLDKICKRAYEERVRQEIQVVFKTAEMTVVNDQGEDVDLLDLRAGNTVKVVVGSDIVSSLGQQPSDQRLAYMLSRGFARSVAEVLVANLEALKTLDNFFHVKTSHVTLEEGNFEISVECHNLINVTGNGSSDTINV